jgi:hypothetical protein
MLLPDLSLPKLLTEKLETLRKSNLSHLSQIIICIFKNIFIISILLLYRGYVVTFT